jgi:hypothetical protein
MYIEHHIWYVRRTDDVHIDECAVYFYEGDIVSGENFDISTKSMVPFTGYQKTRKLTQTDLPYFSNFTKDSLGNDAVLFTPKDFGVISSDEELRIFLNNQLPNDPVRIPRLAPPDGTLVVSL